MTRAYWHLNTGAPSIHHLARESCQIDQFSPISCDDPLIRFSLLPLLALVPLSLAVAEPQMSNIVLILADDMAGGSQQPR